MVRICQDSQLTPSSGQDPTNVHSRTPRHRSSSLCMLQYVSTQKVAFCAWLCLVFLLICLLAFSSSYFSFRTPPNMDASAKWLHQNRRFLTPSYLRREYADFMSLIMTLGCEKAPMITVWFLNWVVFPQLPWNLSFKRLQPLAKSLSLFRFLHLHLNCGPRKIKKFLYLTALPGSTDMQDQVRSFPKLAPFEDAVKPFQICRFYHSWQKTRCRD